MKIEIGNMTVTERDIFNFVGVIFSIITVLLIGGSVFTGENYFTYAFFTFILSSTFYFLSERKSDKKKK